MKSMSKALVSAIALTSAIAAAPLAPLDDEWGSGFVRAKLFTTIIYQNIKPYYMKHAIVLIFCHDFINVAMNILARCPVLVYSNLS